MIYKQKLEQQRRVVEHNIAVVLHAVAKLTERYEDRNAEPLNRNEYEVIFNRHKKELNKWHAKRNVLLSAIRAEIAKEMSVHRPFEGLWACVDVSKAS